ncbi:biopolymer ExbD/TolR family transporter [Burkholderia pseudomallei]|nr:MULTISPECIES: biopolymer transporter ExbD [Burkholderia]EIF60727.1 biopolymer ExbD/TolR family transporter [Burkholderia pseudomallei 1258a]KGW46486.1 biopolymer transport ExbD/TolR family protein [Burkholderia pseudomallei MSHR684]KGX75072.1 biopolymer transport ExbD/TolR family protein [Burkholderia pseudomallei MSHR435]AAU45829.1 biopolymer transport protein, ExbD/TolR family [Burkholderia mallei ATCC 23344]ABA52063.1 biopolymer transport protein, ExbD/TolR family [Burkholderia pseudomal
MAMNTSFGDDDDDGLMNEINMTPLVDVMLVLLIIFLVTIPAMHHAVKIDLPRASSQPVEVKPKTIDVAIESDGTVLWDDHPVSAADLQARIAQAAQTNPQPELHLRADRKVAYERVAEVMSAAQAGGLTKLGFVTEPKSNAK